MVKMSLGYTVIQKTNEFSNDFEKNRLLKSSTSSAGVGFKKKEKKKKKRAELN